MAGRRRPDGRLQPLTEEEIPTSKPCDRTRHAHRSRCAGRRTRCVVGRLWRRPRAEAPRRQRAAGDAPRRPRSRRREPGRRDRLHGPRRPRSSTPSGATRPSSTARRSLVDVFEAAQPEHQRQGDRRRLGHLLGEAPDRARRRRRPRRVRDGRPALPRLPDARRPARPRAVHRPRRLRPRPARRPRRSSDFTTRRRRPVRPAARPQRRRALLQQGDVRRGRHPLPRRHLGLGQAHRGRQAADPRHERRRQDRPVGPLHRDDRHGELLAVAGLAERRRLLRAPTARPRP